jgi:hypothetical protein
MVDAATMHRLLMNRSRFEDMRTDAQPAPEAQIGEVVLALDRFSLTINNITYAAFGNALRYWDFFPTGVEGYGLLPVWGYADVVQSSVDGVEVGQRYFGYFPSATHLVVRPGKTGGRSFRDDSPHRADLPEVYNWYQRSDNDPNQSTALEPLHAIFRPLFVTAFGLSDFLAEKRFFGAEQVIISSASSRTGYSEAFSIGLQRDQLNRTSTSSASPPPATATSLKVSICIPAWRPTTSSSSSTRTARPCTSTSPATPDCSAASMNTSASPWFTTSHSVRLTPTSPHSPTPICRVRGRNSSSPPSGWHSARRNGARRNSTAAWAKPSLPSSATS